VKLPPDGGSYMFKCVCAIRANVFELMEELNLISAMSGSVFCSDEGDGGDVLNSGQLSQGVAAGAEGCAGGEDVIYQNEARRQGAAPGGESGQGAERTAGILSALVIAQAGLATVVGIVALEGGDDGELQQFAEGAGELGGLVVAALLLVGGGGGYGYECGAGEVAVKFGCAVPQFGKCRGEGCCQIVGVAVFEFVDELHVELVAAQS
jgi:hypothetical protein